MPKFNTHIIIHYEDGIMTGIIILHLSGLNPKIIYSEDTVKIKDLYTNLTYPRNQIKRLEVELKD